MRGFAFFVAAIMLFVAGCGGRPDRPAQAPASLGLVSATADTAATVRFENPFDTPAVPSAPPHASPFQVDAASLPGAAVPPGASVQVRVVFSPTSAGVVTGTARLRFSAGGRSRDVDVLLQVEVETPLVQQIAGDPAFGAVPFGTAVERTFTFENRSTLSVVRFSNVTLPPTDFELLAPKTFPIVLVPGARVGVTVRFRPWHLLGRNDGDLALVGITPGTTTGVGLTAEGLAGTASLSLGATEFMDTVSPIIEVDVPAAVYSVTFEAFDPGATYEDSGLPDEAGGGAPPTSARRLRFTNVVAPDGRLLQGWLKPEPGAFSATIPQSDQPRHALSEGGGTYTFQLIIDNTPTLSPFIDVRVIMKAAPDATLPAVGTLDLNIWIADSLGIQQSDVESQLPAVEALLQQAGLALGTVTFFTWADAGPNTQGHALQAALAAATDVPSAVNVFLYDGDAGLSAGIGGTTAPNTIMSWVLVGWSTPRASAIFAHEVLHYLGLFHVWEDPISDTVGVDATNLMGTFTDDTALTPSQGAVVRGHPLVR